MASAQPAPAAEGDLGRLFYRKTRLVHVELPAAVESGIDTKEVDDFRQEILDVMPPVPVPVPAKEGDDDAYVQGLQIAHITLNHICGRLVRTASRVLLDKVKSEIVRDSQSAVGREDIQRYRDEILGVGFSRTGTTSNEEQWQQFKTKIREAVATLNATTSSQEIAKGNVEGRKPLRFSDVVNDDDMDEDEFKFDDEASAGIAHNTSFPDSGTELAHDFDQFSTMDDKDKKAEGCFKSVYVQDPPLPSMVSQDSIDSFSFIPSSVSSSDSFIPSSDTVNLSSDPFNSTSNNCYTDDAYPSSTFYYSIDDSDHDSNNGNIDPRLLQPAAYFNSSPPDSPLLSSGLERPETFFDP
ncbi:hypothetical protein DV737_g3596, partial [Chaetothyriales sp. CBS 132003]